VANHCCKILLASTGKNYDSKWTKIGRPQNLLDTNKDKQVKTIQEFGTCKQMHMERLLVVTVFDYCFGSMDQKK
jgi:hypothetical protein